MFYLHDVTLQTFIFIKMYQNKYTYVGIADCKFKLVIKNLKTKTR